jgi:hypothetical protein
MLAEWQCRWKPQTIPRKRRSKVELPNNSADTKEGLSKEEQAVLAALDYTPASLEQIGALCPQLAGEQLLKALITFCLKGIACQMGAGNYCLKA